MNDNLEELLLMFIEEININDKEEKINAEDLIVEKIKKSIKNKKLFDKVTILIKDKNVDKKITINNYHILDKPENEWMRWI